MTIIRRWVCQHKIYWAKKKKLKTGWVGRNWTISEGDKRIRRNGQNKVIKQGINVWGSRGIYLGVYPRKLRWRPTLWPQRRAGNPVP